MRAFFASILLVGALFSPAQAAPTNEITLASMGGVFSQSLTGTKVKKPAKYRHLPPFMLKVLVPARRSGAAGGCGQSLVEEPSITLRETGQSVVRRLSHTLERLSYGHTMSDISLDARQTVAGSLHRVMTAVLFVHGHVASQAQSLFGPSPEAIRSPGSDETAV
jgi:hypothetical protein